MEGTEYRSALKRYGVALGVSLAAFVLTSLFETELAHAIFAFYMLAVVVTSIYGGMGPGVMVILIGAFVTRYLFLEPHYSLAITPENIKALLPFLTIATVIALVGASRQRAHRRVQQSRELLYTTLRSIGDAVIATDAKGCVTFMNAVAQQLTGWTSEEGSGKSLAEVFNIVNEQSGEPVENPVEKVLKVGTVVGLANHTTLIARDGRRIPIEDSAAPIHGETGEIDGVIMVFHDVTERRRVESEGQFLLEATGLLASTLDYRATLQRVAELAVPGIADWCAVDVLDADGTLWRPAVAHVDPEKVAWAHEIYRRYPPDPNAPTGAYNVIRTGEPEFYPVITKEMIDAAVLDEEQKKIIDAVGFTSVMTVPLITHGKTLGVITFVSAESGRRFTERDLRLATELANSAAMAIENAQLYQEAHTSATALREQALRMSVLAETASIFSSAALDYHALLDLVARRIADLTGDACIVRLISDDASYVDPLAIYHADEETSRALRERAALGRLRSNLSILGQVIEQSEPVMLNAADIAAIPSEKRSDYFPLLKELNVSGLLIVPMRVRGRVIGVIKIAREGERPPYTDDDRTLLQNLADRAALFIDNAMLYRDADEQRNWLQVTLSSIGDAVIATDVEGRITFMNGVARTLTRWDDDAIGRPLEEIFNIINEETMVQVESPVAKVLREGRIVGLANHTRLIARDGTQVPIDDSAAPIRDLDGNLRGVVLVFHDVSEKHQAERERARLHEQVERQSRRLENLISNVPGVVWEAYGDPDAASQRIDFVSEYAEKMLGYSREEWLSTPNFWLSIVHPEDRDRAAQEAGAIFARGGIGESQFRWIAKNGDVRWIDAHSSVIFGEDGIPVGMRGVSMDITDRKVAEERIRESEARFRTLADSAPVMIWMAGADAHCNYLNKGWLDYRGRTAEEEMGMGWREGVHPADQKDCLAIYNNAFERRELFTMEYRLRRHDGAYRWVLDTGVPRFTPDGSFTGYIGSCIDIHDRKEMEHELKDAKESAEAASRSKDQFLAVLSHELRTPLTPVLATAQALEQDEATPVEMRPFLEIIRRNVELEVHLIDDLLDLVRVSRGKLQINRTMTDLHHLLENVVAICRSEIDQKKLSISVKMEAAEHHGLVDPARLQQVFWNLIQNAVKFTPEGGRLEIRTFNDHSGEIAVAIGDSGIGIEPALLSRIFDAFEQGERSITRRYGGLGLGLAISKALTVIHGGRIEAFSEGLDRGATFTVHMPTVSSPAIQGDGQTTLAHNGDEKRGVRILLVDDHEDTNHVMKLLLERQGYNVSSATTFRQGLELGSAESFDLLISDIGLPDGSGLDLIKELSARKPVKAIALSGFGMEGDIQRSREAGFSEHLTKPVTFQKLYEIIRRLTATS